MAHGGYERRRIADQRRPVSRQAKGAALDAATKAKRKKKKSVSLKNQIRSTERMLGKNLPSEVREALEKKLEEFKQQQELQSRLAVERKIFLRDRKIKFFERRKIERMIRRLEKQQRTTSDCTSEANISEQLAQLKQDLEYVRFFPKTEKYVSLFSGGDSSNVVDKRNKLRKQIKDRLLSSTANGKELEETGSDEGELLDVSEDDFFLSGSSSDEADADDEWTDKSARELASSASCKVTTSGISSDEKNQRHISNQACMLPPLSHPKYPSSVSADGRGSVPSRYQNRKKPEHSLSSNTSHSWGGSSARHLSNLNSRAGHSSNLSSNSDAHKPRRKRRPKKKTQAQRSGSAG